MTLLRALLHRAGSSLSILVLAVFAVAAATAGPTYDEAARHSILHDGFATAPISGRDLQATAYGDVGGTANHLRGLMTVAFADAGGPSGAARIARLFAAPLETDLLTLGGPRQTQVQLAYRQGACAVLRFAAGRCPRSAREIAVGPRTADADHLRVGDTLDLSPGGRMTITGIYAAPDVESASWLGLGSTLFPQEVTCAQLSGCPQGTDAVFTPASTLGALPPTAQVRVSLDYLVRRSQLTPADVPLLARIAPQVTANYQLYENQVTISTSLPATVGRIRASWQALSVPIVIVSLEVVLLAWALQFLIVAGAAESRAGEIALAKLRGFGRLRTLMFGLGEPAALLLVALPAGALLGWLAARVLSAFLLAPHTPIGLPASGWLAAGLATVVGMLAAALGGRASLARPVVEQWRRTVRHANRRGWVLDAVIGVAALAGLFELVSSGGLRSSHRDPVALLVPGLLGIAVAVTASRLLPLVARWSFGATRRGGGLAGFLAARHIARRPAATRAMAILAAATALAVFGLASWSAGSRNRTTVADLTVGAPTVYSVTAVPPDRLLRAVGQVDPTGRSAAAVLSVSSGQARTLAVQPARFAAVAAWGPAGVGTPAAVLAHLEVPAPPPLTVTGGRLRLRLHAGRLNPSPDDLVLDVAAPGGSAQTPVDLGPIASGRTVVRTVHLPARTVQIVDLDASPAHPSLSFAEPTAGAVSLLGLTEPAAGGEWRPVPGALQTGRWRPGSLGDVTAGGQGLHWRLDSPPRADATLVAADVLARPPAVVSGLTGSAGGQATGLDGRALAVRPAGRVPTVPGSPGPTTLVGFDQAVRASHGAISAANQQVWTDGSGRVSAAALRRAGLHVLSTASAADYRARLTRAGPGLASVLYLADAAAAMVLAALGAIVGLATAARRRRYEYAALVTSGVPARSLFGALALEQGAIVLGGVLTGVVAGLAAAALVVRDVPEFVARPASIPLSYQPSVPLLAVAIACAFVALLALTVASATQLLRSIGVERLREGPA